MVHADETFARAVGKTAYVHVACTDHLTLMHTGDRSAKTIDAGGVLTELTGVLVRDVRRAATAASRRCVGVVPLGRWSWIVRLALGVGVLRDPGGKFLVQKFHDRETAVSIECCDRGDLVRVVF